MVPDKQINAGGSSGVLRRILVGYDGSTEAQRALRTAVVLASEIRGDVHALLVVRPPAHVETTHEQERAVEAELEILSRGFSEIVEHAEPCRAITADVVFADEPAKAIAQWAQEYGFDLIVVGGHGREQVTHGGIGHAVEALLRLSPCPILVV